ncbi:MAG TPA: YicC/YloC family endoribonuclease [Candidatus Didemnitutus sp.]|nr:YicC/YloC family endoribonuclease [Candidatus Didemnitutus sp.]
MNSMTGFGRGSASLGALRVTVQVDSVNRRGLDLSVALPKNWEGLESAITEVVRKSVARGKVRVVVECEGGSVADGWDEAAVSATLDRLKALAQTKGIAFHPTTELLWQIAREGDVEAGLPDAHAAWTAVDQALQEGLRGLVAMRAREGEALLVDFLTRLEKLRGQLDIIVARAPQVPGAYREQLLQRLRSAGLELDLSDERVLKEVALFADRCDISEEITRLRSHLSQLRELLRSGAEVGRKSEFILQEIGREIHTIGSKANDLGISQQVIEFKNELERVREQIANVE